MKTVFSMTLLFLSATVSGQNFQTVKVNVPNQEIQIDNFTITKSTEIDQIIKVFGTPERTEKISGYDRVYAYDSKGIAFNLAPGGSRKIEAVNLTYTYDNDPNVAKEKYKGTVIINGFTVTEKTRSKDISKNAKVKLECMGTLCMNDPEGEGALVMIGYTESGAILQMMFGFKQ